MSRRSLRAIRLTAASGAVFTVTTTTFQLLGLTGLQWVLLAGLGAIGPMLWPRTVHRRKDRGLQLAAAVLVLLPVAAGVGVDAMGESDKDNGSAETAGKALSPDPYLYAAFDGQRGTRKQDCVGLFGLCLGQRVDSAVAAFGPNEAPGYPAPGIIEKSWTCHGWAPSRFRLITVCEKGGAISSITAFFSTESRIELALATGDPAILPTGLANLARQISGDLKHAPNFMSSLDGEGYWSDSFGWYFISRAEGMPYALIEISGPEFWSKATTKERPRACNYDHHLATTESVRVDRIEVRDLYPRDTHQNACRL